MSVQDCIGGEKRILHAQVTCLQKFFQKPTLAKKYRLPSHAASFCALVTAEQHLLSLLMAIHVVQKSHVSKITAGSKYFNTVNFARRVHCQAKLSGHIFDTLDRHHHWRKSIQFSSTLAYIWSHSSRCSLDQQK